MVNQLRKELVQNVGDSEKIARVLEEKVSSFFLSCKFLDVNPFLELLNKLGRWPHLALEVFSQFKI